MDVSGVWYNELNSTMTLKVNGKELSGSYVSAVGDAKGSYDLIGYVDPSEFTPVLGWVVVWVNKEKTAHATTSWSGQARLVDEAEHLDTMWLLTSSTSNQDSWQATMVGHDWFSRTKATDEQVRQAKLARGMAVEPK